MEKALANKDLDAALEAIAVLHHFLSAANERMQKRLNFFANSLESARSDTILFHKGLREDNHPYSSTLYGDTKRKFDKLCSNAFTKELNKKKAKTTGNKGGKAPQK